MYPNDHIVELRIYKELLSLFVFWPRSPQAEFYRRYSETPEGTHPRFDELPAGSRLMYVRNPR